jgi:hypothetical protein
LYLPFPCEFDAPGSCKKEEVEEEKEEKAKVMANPSPSAWSVLSLALLLNHLLRARKPKPEAITKKRSDSA